ncbi:RagB/SusD family nutrient uptake outer membrane protein [Flavobacterium sp. LHD-80]|uniref:RagB/SusD family nutrient uptake outer membrane protein n=1 Tax=Flavobacterium sp. LHD-80 TaxID=3071411 RepID=UPI0027E0CF0C|nr:RagB/SusD family nutrient uptake outer membrane protein [Flavobacterium sp. LHD-80]MDQ6470849.1 RagB/SusD family nutrient uptake outer membrane protein [Flavobacterium sp. LHD-80]
MKPIQIKTFLATAMITLFLGACSNVLEEEPRSIYTPEYFKTEKGVVAGLTSMYAHLRYIYGQGYYYNTTETGTDEATYAQSADANFKDMDLSGVGSITPSSSRADALWQPAFININTASGVIENATAIGTVSNAMIAEARFFRAFDYFLLVQTFGGVPLDLGAGELKFNTSPSRFSVRNTVPQVYTKGIFPDLVIAANDLPDAGRVKGGLTKTAARLYLAKAYLTYAWWLKNPNNIPTYPETTRVDPDGHDAAWYFQKAYDVAATAIDSHGAFALQPTYYDVNLGSNDRNSEILLYADHTEKSEFFNASSLTFSNGNAPENFTVWMMTPNYTVLRSSGVSSVQREAVQSLGRPFIRMCPTIGAIANTFADKTNDSRYDGTFTTVYRGNWNKAGITTPTLNNANGLPVAPGGAILSFLNAENPAIVYAAGNGAEGGAVGAGVLPGRSDFVIAPSGISRIIYPGLWKLGTYRTDNGTGLGSPNGASTRPYNIAKLSELYLIAAEAAVMGAAPQGGKSARELVNVLRARAGKWRFDNGGNVAKSADNSAAMIAATPAVIDINYILAERSREYFGEGYRWYDLLRTQKWTELSSSYQICGPAYGNHTPLTVARDIKPYHYLRPIPQVQFDAMIMTASEKAAYQNPGY